VRLLEILKTEDMGKNKPVITKHWDIPEEYENDILYQTLTGEIIHPEAKGLLYLCDYDFNTYDLKVVRAISFKCPIAALEAYANIPNPESQLARGNTIEEFHRELEQLHKNMLNHEWRKELTKYL